MNKKTCLNMIESMMPDIHDYIGKEANRLLSSGGINLEPCDNDSYLPAKAVLTVILNNLKDQYCNFDNQDFKDIVDNLKHF